MGKIPIMVVNQKISSFVMTQDSRITNFISTMLRPVIRLALRHSLHLQTLLDLVKKLLVEEAINELQKEGDTTSISRISAMTGVHRKDIANIRNQCAMDEGNLNIGQRRTLSVIQRVLNNWQAMIEFQETTGKPKVLSFGGKSSEFHRLVNSVSTDLNPYSVLFELERSGAAKKTENGLKLLAGIENLKGNPLAAYTLLAQDIRDFSQAVEENIQNKDSDANLHIRTEYDNISADYLPEIRTWLLKEGSSLHGRARQYLSRFDRDINPAAPGETFAAKVILGSFSLTENPINIDTDRNDKKERGPDEITKD